MGEWWRLQETQLDDNVGEFVTHFFLEGVTVEEDRLDKLEKIETVMEISRAATNISTLPLVKETFM